MNVVDAGVTEIDPGAFDVRDVINSRGFGEVARGAGGQEVMTSVGLEMGWGLSNIRREGFFNVAGEMMKTTSGNQSITFRTTYRSFIIVIFIDISRRKAS